MGRPTRPCQGGPTNCVVQPYCGSRRWAEGGHHTACETAAARRPADEMASAVWLPCGPRETGDGHDYGTGNPSSALVAARATRGRKFTRIQKRQALPVDSSQLGVKVKRPVGSRPGGLLASLAGIHQGGRIGQGGNADRGTRGLKFLLLPGFYSPSVPLRKRNADAVRGPN